MRRFRLLLLALLFILSTSASAIAPLHQCCQQQDCGIAHCVDMGCVAALPDFAFDRPATSAPARRAEVHAIRSALAPLDRFEEVWTPPD